MIRRRWGVCRGGGVGLVATASLVVFPLGSGVSAHGASGPYRWVQPPPDAIRGNVVPGGRDTPLLLGPNGDAPTAVWTPDLQAVLSLPSGAFAPEVGSAGVAASMQPIAPSRAPPLAAGQAADGNAHRVTLSSGGVEAALRTPAALVLTVPRQPARAVLWSVDGSRWRVARSRPAQEGHVEVEVVASGIYLAVDDLTSDGGPLVTLRRGIAINALGVGGVLCLRWWRRRRRA